MRFSAEILLDCCAGIEIRAVLDGSALALPSKAIYLAAPIGAISGHTFEFVFPSITPGIHTLRMQFRSAFGDPVLMFHRNTIVQFVP